MVNRRNNDLKSESFEPMRWLKDRFVLYCRDNDSLPCVSRFESPAGDADQREIVRLGRAGREYDLRGGGSDQFRDSCPRCSDRSRCQFAENMRRSSICWVGPGDKHRLSRLWRDRHGRKAVKINGLRGRGHLNGVSDQGHSCRSDVATTARSSHPAIQHVIRTSQFPIPEALNPGGERLPLTASQGLAVPLLRGHPATPREGEAGRKAVTG